MFTIYSFQNDNLKETDAKLLLLEISPCHNYSSVEWIVYSKICAIPCLVLAPFILISKLMLLCVRLSLISLLTVNCDGLFIFVNRQSCLYSCGSSTLGLLQSVNLKWCIKRIPDCWWKYFGKRELAKKKLLTADRCLRFTQTTRVEILCMNIKL